jgi:hypothetical protein
MAVSKQAVHGSESIPASEGTSSDVIDLFHCLQATFPSETLGEDKWYLIAITSLTSLGKTNSVADLYLYLINQPQYAKSETRKILMQRLREALVKCVSVIGVCRPLEAVFCIDAVTKEEDKDFSYAREHWTCDKANHERGTSWLRKLYGADLDPINETFNSHRDFGWISREITYGLYLSDHRILDGVESELVVLSGIMVQDLPKMTAWHLRACRRIGFSQADCERVQTCVSSESFGEQCLTTLT